MFSFKENMNIVVQHLKREKLIIGETQEYQTLYQCGLSHIGGNGVAVGTFEDLRPRNPLVPHVCGRWSHDDTRGLCATWAACERHMLVSQQ